MRKDGAVTCFGEVLLRLSAPGAELMLQTPRLDVCVGGAEANVAVSLACLGHDVRMMSAAPDNALGRAAIEELRRWGVDVTRIEHRAGRMGLYFLTPGAGPRAAEIIYDRAHSSFADQDFTAIDWRRALEGAAWLHISGVTAALNQNAADAAIRAAQAARKAGVTLSFDCNYRAKLWDAWSGDGRAILGAILGEADLLFGDHRDIGLILGKSFEGEGRAAADAAFAAFPNLQCLAATRRVQHSVNHHELAAVMHARDQSWAAPAMDLTHIVDRIGAGDAFAAGIIHGIRRAMPEEKSVRFALAAAALKHVTPGDFNLAREADVEAVLSAGLDIRR
ncbi:MAG: PfkB family carbohydrate kinase [Hyphomonadaceae bacterium]